MIGFENRLTAALREVAEEAPSAAGLGAGATARARVRRRRRGVAVSAATVLAVLAVVLPLSFAGPLHGRAPSADSSPAPSAPIWRTHTYDGASIDVPAGCRIVIGNETGGAVSCLVQVIRGYKGVVSTPGLRFEAGSWIGMVEEAGPTFFIGAADRATALRIVASVRPAGVTIPDLSLGWTTVQADGSVVDVPRALGATAISIHTYTPGLSIPLSLPATHRSGPDWVAAFPIRGGGAYGRVVAPTRVLAELIASTARWSTVQWVSHELDGVTFETPPSWVLVPAFECGRRSLTIYAAPAGDRCDDADSVTVGRGILDTSLTSTPTRTQGQWAGYRPTSVDGGRYVIVSTNYYSTTQRILDSVGRTAASPDVWHTVTEDGVWLDVPVGCSPSAVTAATCRGLTQVEAKTIGASDSLAAPGIHATTRGETPGGLVTLIGLNRFVLASGSDRAVVRRVLASARPVGTPDPPHLDQPWVTRPVAHRVRASSPADQPSAYGARPAPSSAPLTLAHLSGDTWVSVIQPRGQLQRIQVVEPTEALAELVAASASARRGR